MLKFFRNIRRGLLTENRFGKYVLYAIGEIILVVIGILIALSINNANERRITREKEQTYLKGLENEFEASKLKLQTLIEVNKRSYQSAKALLVLLQDTATTPEEARLSQLLYDAFAFEIAYNPNNSLLDEIINSGSLNAISNDDLRLYLTSWESIIENIRIQEQDLRHQRENVREMLRSENGSIRTVFDQTNVTETVLNIPVVEENFSNLPLLQSRPFENKALSFALTAISAESSHYLPLHEQLETILTLIASEKTK
ncbi:MAG: DUF6090 family protein [Altibacter sp.]|nr:DUF6090 family protein [Altibacter sp.]